MTIPSASHPQIVYSHRHEDEIGGVDRCYTSNVVDTMPLESYEKRGAESLKLSSKRASAVDAESAGDCIVNDGQHLRNEER